MFLFASGSHQNAIPMRLMYPGVLLEQRGPELLPWQSPCIAVGKSSLL